MAKLMTKTILTIFLLVGITLKASALEEKISKENFQVAQDELLVELDQLIEQVDNLAAIEARLDQEEKEIEAKIETRKGETRLAQKSDSRELTEEEALKMLKGKQPGDTEEKAEDVSAREELAVEDVEVKIDQIISETNGYAAMEDAGNEVSAEEGKVEESTEEKEAKSMMAVSDDKEQEEKEQVADETSKDVTPAPDEKLNEKNYWDMTAEDQTLEELSKNQKIREAYKEAKKTEQAMIEQQKLRMQNMVKVEKMAPVVLTPSNVISSVINPDLASERIDLDFADTSLSDLIMTIGKTANMNIVLDPALKNNKIDLHVKEVTIEEALLLIANTNDLGFKKVESSLYITYREKLRHQNLASEVIKLRNISVEQARLLVQDLIETVSASEEINSLIVIGEPENIVAVQNVIAKIDKQQPQVVLEAKIIEVNKDALKDLGVDWSDQINIAYQESSRPADFLNVEDSPDSTGKIFQLSRTPIQFETIIKILENQNNAKVLSNPRITTLNDKEAEIFVGDRIPYTVTNVTGGVVTTDVRWVEPGIRLIITPSIIEDDFVVLKVEPEVSFIFAFRGPNDEFPQVKTREATSYVRVKNNEPFVLGGLLNQEDKQNLFKVPLLGDIPWIGNLFSYEKHSILDTELIITITPMIVHGDE